MNTGLPPPLRILIVRLSAHGDVIQTLPLLHAIKSQHPNAYIGWLVEPSATPLLENHPLIDRLHILPQKTWLRALRNPLRWPRIVQEFFRFYGQIKASQYVHSLDVQGLLKSAIWPWLLKIPQRLGYSNPREKVQVFYTQHLPSHQVRESQKHIVLQSLDMLKLLSLEPPSYPTYTVPLGSLESQEKVRHWLTTSLKPLTPIIAIAPFTRWPSKHWPINHWRTLIDSLLSEQVSIIVLGGPENQSSSRSLLESYSDNRSVLNLVGQTDWQDLYVLFKQVKILIGLDSAILHLANAVGSPTIIGLYGPTSPQRTGPIGKLHHGLTTQLACQPCHRKRCPIQTDACMQQLLPEQVYAAVKQVLEAPPLAKLPLNTSTVGEA